MQLKRGFFERSSSKTGTGNKETRYASTVKETQHVFQVM